MKACSARIGFGVLAIGFMVLGCSFDRPAGHETGPSGEVTTKTRKIDMWNRAEWSLSEYMYRTWNAGDAGAE